MDSLIPKINIKSTAKNALYIYKPLSLLVLADPYFEMNGLKQSKNLALGFLSSLSAIHIR